MLNYFPNKIFKSLKQFESQDENTKNIFQNIIESVTQNMKFCLEIREKLWNFKISDYYPLWIKSCNFYLLYEMYIQWVQKVFVQRKYFLKKPLFLKSKYYPTRNELLNWCWIDIDTSSSFQHQFDVDSTFNWRSFLAGLLAIYS